MKINHLFIALALMALFFSSGCTQEIEKAQEGASNLVCMARGNVDCVKQAYGNPMIDDNESDSGTSGNGEVESDNSGISVTEMSAEDVVEGYNSTGVIKLQTRGNEFEARNVNLDFDIVGNISFIGNNTFDVPIEWGFEKSYEKLSPNETETISFKIPSGTDKFDPTTKEKYTEKFEDDYFPEKQPWEFDSSLKISYDHKIPMVFPYKVYNEEYYESHSEEIDSDLELRCQDYKGSQAQLSSTSDNFISPVDLTVYTRSCKIFEDQKFLVNVKASSDHKFEILNDDELLSEGCERKSDLKGNSSSDVEWACEFDSPDQISSENTRHFIFELEYHIERELGKENFFKILKE